MFDRADGHGLQRPGGFHGGVAIGHGLEGVGRRSKLEAGIVAQMRGHPLRELDVRVDPRAEGCATDGELGQRVAGLRQAANPVLDLRGVSREFLPQADRHSVLQVSPADLDDGVELDAFGLEERVQIVERWHQLLANTFERGDMNSRRDHVVGRLPHVDRVVGVDGGLTAPLTGELLVGDAGDHLVGVHVRRGAGACLKDVDDKLIVMLTVGDGLRGLDDRGSEIGVEQFQVHVDLRGGLLDQSHRPDEGPRHPQ